MDEIESISALPRLATRCTCPAMLAAAAREPKHPVASRGEAVPYPELLKTPGTMARLAGRFLKEPCSALPGSIRRYATAR